jgi:hypothetical protein
MVRLVDQIRKAFEGAWRAWQQSRAPDTMLKMRILFDPVHQRTNSQQALLSEDSKWDGVYGEFSIADLFEDIDVDSLRAVDRRQVERALTDVLFQRLQPDFAFIGSPGRPGRPRTNLARDAHWWALHAIEGKSPLYIALAESERADQTGQTAVSDVAVTRALQRLRDISFRE